MLLGDPGEIRAEPRPVAVDDAVDVGRDHVHRPGSLEQAQDRGAGRTGPRHDDPDPRQLLVHQPQSVEQRSQDHDRRAVLVVVEHRDVELVAEAALDLETPRRGDVLEVDAGEPRRDRLDRGDDPVDVLGVEADRPGVDLAEPLEQCRLALHHGQRGHRSDVAETEDGRPVRDDGDAVALDGQPAGVLGVRGDGEADPGDPGGVDQREVVAVADRVLGLHLDLAAEVHEEGAVRHPPDGHPRNHPHDLDELVGVGGVAGGAGDVDANPVMPGGRDVQGRDDPPGLLHGGRQEAHRVPRRHLQTDGDRVRHARHGRHGCTLRCDSDRLLRAPEIGVGKPFGLGVPGTGHTGAET